jgi:CBS domain containing-hemolysin-like protein
MLTDLGLVLLLALGNAFFALAEIALIASRKSRLRYMARSSARRLPCGLPNIPTASCPRSRSGSP